MLKVQKVYYCEYNHQVDEDGREYCETHITTNLNEARKLDKRCRLAKINEVIELTSLGYDILEVIEVEEGIFGYMEKKYIDSFGDTEYFSEYVWMKPNSNEEIRDIKRIIDKTINNKFQ
ncbi:hypothetical protein ACR77J_08135 [Tissierella praeacuta]|uniref:hypothetical protein n=1 Tax=Tissierella praeacuta TaxID=43131 RepID=UPI003DA4B55B